MNVRSVFIFLLLILALPLVNAVPPVTSLQSDNSFILKYPEETTLRHNAPFEFEIHVYNSSNGVPITSNIGCYMHLYNSTGKHIYEGYDDTASHNFDYSFDLNANNFSKIGYYYYVVQCNHSSRGGFVSVPILVTHTGNDPIGEGQSISLFSSIWVILILAIVFCYLGIRSNIKGMRVLLIGTGFVMFFIYILYSAVIVNDTVSIFENLTSGYGYFMMVIWSIAVISVVFLVCYALVLAWLSWQRKRGFID